MMYDTLLTYIHMKLIKRYCIAMIREEERERENSKAEGRQKKEDIDYKDGAVEVKGGDRSDGSGSLDHLGYVCTTGGQ